MSAAARAMVPLGELIQRAATRLAGNNILPVLSMTMHEGLIPQDAKFNKRVASADLSGYRVVSRGQLVVGFPIDEGVLAFQELHAEAVVSPAYGLWDLRDKSNVSRAYLGRYLQSNRAISYYAARMKGTTARRRSLSAADFLALPVPLPPLVEQRRIADILDRVDDLRAKRQAAIDKLDSLTQAIFHDMFGDENFHPDRESPVELDSLCCRITDGTHQSPEWTPDGVPFLFVSNITSGEIDLATSKFISFDTHNELTKRCPVELGDVLYSTVGSYGVPAVVRTSQPFAFQRHIAHIKPNPSLLNPHFLRALLLSDGVKRQADRAARGVAQKTVNLGDIKKFRVPCPELNEQERFAARARDIEKLKWRAEEGESLTAHLAHSIAQEAFSGAL